MTPVTLGKVTDLARVHQATTGEGKEKIVVMIHGEEIHYWRALDYESDQAPP